MRSAFSNVVPLAAPSARNLVRLLVVPALALAFHSAPAFAGEYVCTNATLVGAYGWTIQGFAPNPDGTISPTKGVAITDFDGAGKFTQRDFVETAGVPQASNGGAQTGFQFSTGETGKYSLNPDCTGTAEIDLNVPIPGEGGTIKLMLVVTNGGRVIHTVVSELIPPGTTVPSLVTTSSEAWKIAPDTDAH